MSLNSKVLLTNFLKFLIFQLFSIQNAFFIPSVGQNIHSCFDYKPDRAGAGEAALTGSI